MLIGDPPPLAQPRDGVRSRRYPDRVDCPGCGLDVAGNRETAAVRPHRRRARLALKHGRIARPCTITEHAR